MVEQDKETSTEVLNINATTEERFPGVRANIVKQMLAASDQMNIEESLRFCTEDVLYQFGNFPVVFGKQGIRDSSSGFFQNFKTLKHNVLAIWEVENIVIVQMKVSYTRHDGKVFNLPCCNIIRMTDIQVQEMRIYMDINPVFS